MSNLRCSYEPMIGDPDLKHSVPNYHPSLGQATNCDNGQPCNTDNDSVSPRETANTQHSAMSALKVDQAGMIWGSNGTLLGKIQDDGFVNPEVHPPNGQDGVLNQEGQKTGQAFAHETIPCTSLGNAREHPFYKLNPDENGQYHCPYGAIEHCWYMPQKLKSKFDEHLDKHLKPYRCNLFGCSDAHFSSAGRLLSHESHAHNIDHGAKTYLDHSHDGVKVSDENTTPSFSTNLSHGDVAAPNMHGPSRKLPVRSFQASDPHVRSEIRSAEPLDETHMKARKLPVRSFQASDPHVRNEIGVAEPLDEAHMNAPPAKVYHKTASLGSNDKMGMEGFDTPIQPKHTFTPKSQHHPKLTAIPSISPVKQTEDNKKIVIDVDFLHKLESKISDLESRVEECEGRPDSPTNSSILDSEDSVDSVSDVSRNSFRESRHPRRRSLDSASDVSPRSFPEARHQRHFDDDFIDIVHVGEPSLRVARWKCFGDLSQVEVVNDETPFHRFANKPLLKFMEDYCPNNKLWRRRLDISSPAFYELLREVSGHNLNDIALHDGVFYLTEPFMVLFLNRKQLTEHVERTNEVTQAKEHAIFVLGFLEREFSDVSRMLDNFESLTPPNLVKYCDLWMLYRPGTTVYSRANGEWEAFIIDSLDGMQLRKPSVENHHLFTRLDIRAWSMNFDGEVYGRVWSLHCVAPFHGTRDISSLPLVPEKYLLDGKTIRESLVSRGKKFCTTQLQHCQLSGISTSRVMVDHLTYQKRNGWLISIDGKHGPSSKDSSWTKNSYSDWDTSSEAVDRRPRRYTPQRSLVRHFENEYCNRDYKLEGIEENEDTQAEPCRTYSTDRPSHVVVGEFEKYNLIGSVAEMDELSLILLPQHVRAFCLRDKVWKFLDVSQLKPVSFDETAWNGMVLDEEYKDIMETMVSSHVDKVAGGGKGLSILLHGEPGVGKTLTAESIANLFGKPFFPVTSGDLGTSVPRFDEKLEEIADYATKWGAILLFDEAEVILQARRDYECANLKRNDLVSSFVRFIEYYQGIVFITTNRISRFDGAIMPRIDITLSLPPLDRSGRQKIWCNEIQTLFDEDTVHRNRSQDLRVLSIQKWSQDDLNGHQIKKAVKTAKIVAEKKGRMLGHREIETMLKIEREFQERIGHVKKEKEKDEKVGGQKDKEDLEGFEQVEKP